MSEECIRITSSGPLHGEVSLAGAKNAVLVIMASTLLTEGTSVITNVPISADVFGMIRLLEELGASVSFDQELKRLTVDTRTVNKFTVSPELMKKMRASVLVMGPLLARFQRAHIVFPGGCLIGARPIDYHLKNFKKMGVEIHFIDEELQSTTKKLQAGRIALEYPSVGATENILMAATLTEGTTSIVNAALEPEVLDLIVVLKKMGAKINILPPATIEITGVSSLHPYEHEVLADRLEAGSLLLAGAITGGDIFVTNARAYDMDVFLMKLEEMGHHIEIGHNGVGVRIEATPLPEAVSFKTGPYPGFPTDLQSPMMVAQCLAAGTCEIHETVFENRFLHVRELLKMGAQVKFIFGDKVQVKGVEALYGTHVIATDIRASCALVLAGLAAKGKTVMTGISHWRRGYDKLEEKLIGLGACMRIESETILALGNEQECLIETIER
ncbi:TPA: UDP-N-acetylglucosamine 1-carboxyvinyltransferase [Candidatus Dependentiae bacterium]|nr:MAG: UDP-N-acetylglucosamine enolpyruvyl transferase [candidate division TM6 bacterium GW2011_GWF2_36_131]KKQ02879.1 MAG: UDP-N-acetylglucosamine enolpyruvyl transferase [candidate division TM6 bacterium GW2011_GWE2_36_25]KKQ19531.1 MAG: UDP-N-acetylglucosamine enolpyruvyl transferase [candidate division TM6 bacterium GW2011_GWA2_36_9]HBR70244.1 UDP-N-acetylglucosamine 1-carboxyvinyltransferase [Candidatus Dependentiae bacterium]HCU00628.1 UDP-N-acetylglucosamine 1-carboxyvinyltransferase [C